MLPERSIQLLADLTAVIALFGYLKRFGCSEAVAPVEQI